MNVQEIKNAITNLNSDELSRFREWFKEFDTQDQHEEKGNAKPDGFVDPITPIEKLKKLQGSLKGSGALKVLIDERLRD